MPLNIDEELAKAGLTREQYEACMNDISDKINGLNDMDWSEIQLKHNISLNAEGLRKANSRPFGGAFAKEYYSNIKHNTNNLDEKLEQIRKERIKLQTLNIERGRLDRKEARQELFFDMMREVMQKLDPPEFEVLSKTLDHGRKMSYVLTLSDIHYGSNFVSQNNEYSRDIAKERFQFLLDDVQQFVKEQKINTLTILEMGDSIQGLLRLSDLNINDTSVVKCVVEISRIIASFLNELSKFVNINYYHVPSANHTQLRVLNTKASELADEDVEFIIGNYIKDLLSQNERVKVYLADDGDSYVKVNIFNHSVYAMHGHQIKNIDTSIRDLSSLVGEPIDYLILGHFHSGKELPNYERYNSDAEVLISPSFIGSDPYSDKLMRGSKAAVKIYGFDEIFGHTESYKFILN